jgi:hypothetical protein
MSSKTTDTAALHTAALAALDAAQRIEAEDCPGCEDRDCTYRVAWARQRAMLPALLSGLRADIERYHAVWITAQDYQQSYIREQSALSHRTHCATLLAAISSTPALAAEAAALRTALEVQGE